MLLMQILDKHWLLYVAVSLTVYFWLSGDLFIVSSTYPRDHQDTQIQVLPAQAPHEWFERMVLGAWFWAIR